MGTITEATLKIKESTLLHNCLVCLSFFCNLFFFAILFSFAISVSFVILFFIQNLPFHLFSSQQINTVYINYRLQDVDAFNFVMELARLLQLYTYLASAILCYLYNCLKLITSIMRCFSCVVPSRTRQLYNDLKLVQKINRMLYSIIFLSVAVPVHL